MTATAAPHAPGASIRSRNVALLGSAATFLALLDSTVANLAVSALHGTFPRASVADFSWVISLYAVTFAAFLAPAGRLADVVGRRALFAAGVAWFGVTSLLCAVAPTLGVLLAARGLQGAGAALMIPASLGIILHDSPPARRLAYVGMWSAAASVAAGIGPVIGGLLIQAFTWRAVFLINVPITIGVLAAVRLIPASQRQRGPVPDIAGTIALAAGTGGIVLAITEGPSWGWVSARTLGLLAAGIVITALALWRSARHPVPAVQVALWRSRTFALANVVSLFFGAGLYAYLLVGPLFLVNEWHYSERTAGFALFPGALLAAAAGIGAGRLRGRWRDPRLLVTTGAFLIVCTTALLVFYLPSRPHFLALWLPTVCVAGFGIGAVSTGVSTAAALSVQPPQFASATGLNMAARQVGGALGIGVLAALVAVGGASTSRPFMHILLFSTIAFVVAGIAGAGLALRAAPAPSPQAARAATDAAA